MAPQFASQQPTGFKNHIETVAIVGAGGSVGKFVAEALVAGGKHKVTALTRPESTNKLADGVEAVKVDYNDHAALVAALKGQDAFVITMSVKAPQDQQQKLIAAAAEAGVPWILPNEYSVDSDQVQMGTDNYLLPPLLAGRKQIESLGKSAWIALTCSFWYEFSLGGGLSRYGFDLRDRSVIFFDDGTQKICTSTWLQCGRAAARLLSLKVLPDDESDDSLCLDRFRNKVCYFNSFLVSQKDMFESLLRVTDTTEKDWKISYESSKERFADGHAKLKKGDMSGWGQQMYSRVFYPTGEGDYSSKLHNEILGLPKEDLDEATKEAVRISQDVIDY